MLARRLDEGGHSWLQKWFLPILMFIQSAPGLSQIDTLSYFHPAKIETLGVAFTGDVDDAAVYFSPEAGRRYDWLELQFLFVPTLKPPPNFELTFQLRASRPDTTPGDKLAPLRVPIRSADDMFPNWKTVDLRDSAWSRNWSGDFWLSGQMEALVVSRGSQGHSFVHIIPPLNRWQTVDLEFAIRAIVKYTGPVSVADRLNRSHLDEPELFVSRDASGATRIIVQIKTRQQAQLTIFNLLGQKVITLHSGMLAPGQSVFLWDGQSRSKLPVATGRYFAVLYSETGRKMRPLLVKR
ncbi:MAG: hypothetical protein Q9P14_13805 [candidate division KSB1 bacterium]|nr:hypothetical protein [candidate division KSB1 bacterium]